MKFGYCTSIDITAIRDLAAAGFDYVELALSALAEYPDMAGLKKELRDAGIPCRACNLFFPPSLKLVGQNRDVPGIEAYLARMLPLAADLGVETVVFGNGGARRAQEGDAPDEVYKHLRDLVERMEPHAARAGLKIAVEPLNAAETNMINNYAQAVELTEGLTHVATMVDSYHVLMDNQSYEDVLARPDRLFHLHTAYSPERLVPALTDDTAAYAPFVAAVRQANYNDKISIEGKARGSFAEALGALRQIWKD